MAVRVVLADDHEIFRQGLRSLIEESDGIQVVGEASDGRTVISLVGELGPDVVIMDVAMPHLNGIEATRQIVGQDHQAKVVALSMHSDTEFISRMLEAGASAYLLKDGPFEELISAVKEVVQGKIHLSPSIAGAVVQDYLRRLPQKDRSVYELLTPREREVLQLMAEGHSAKEAAADLGVSAKTVSTHRRNIMEKLDLHSVPELTKFAIRQGLTFLES